MSRNDLPNEKAPNFNARLRETLMTYLGKSGDPLDRGITLRDLIDSNIVSLADLRAAQRGGSLPLSPGNAVAPVGSDPTPPPTPTGFTVTPAISTLLIEHDTPTYAQGHGHLRTHVYGAIRTSPTDPAPVFADAAEITQFGGTVASYATNPSTTWHLWIKWETVDGVLSASPAGGTNGVVATTGQDVGLLLNALAGQISASSLNSTLSSRIDLIDASGTGLVTKVADLQTTYGTTASAAQSAASAAQAATNSATNAAAAAQSASDAVTAKSAAITAKSGAETARDSAVTAKTSAETAAANASTSATSASNSASSANTSASNAATSATTAANSATAAGNSATAAATSATNASTYATNAETASTASTNAKVAAQSARDAAQTSANSAATSASTATTKASDAATSATAANTSATSAATSAGNASTSATNAATSETNALTSANSAATSATAAATSATNAGNSASAAATSASTASTKATDAATSATAANTSATNAATSASNALTYKNDAATSASTATTKAADASTSAGAAATSATSAANSASAASTSASTASTKASDAATSATSASTSATNAATSESNALTYKNDASTSASTATTKASDASTSAGAAATSATNAANSATAAATSASTASTKATEASQSATAANTSKTQAATSASNAATSASNAATSETNAAGSATSAANSLSSVTAIANGYNTTVNSAIQQRMIARAASDGSALAEYSVVTDVNGRIAGFGLGSEVTATGGAASSTFGIRADKFYIAAPTDFSQEAQPGSASTGQLWFKPSNKLTYRYNGSAWVAFNTIVPFTVQTTTTTVNGVTVNPGVYMDAAYIKDGTITNAKIGNLAVDDAKISALDATKITTGFLDAARIQAGSLDAKIANINAATITSGTIDSARIGDATITTAKISEDLQSTAFVDNEFATAATNLIYGILSSSSWVTWLGNTVPSGTAGAPGAYTGKQFTLASGIVNGVVSAYTPFYVIPGQKLEIGLSFQVSGAAQVDLIALPGLLTYGTTSVTPSSVLPWTSASTITSYTGTTSVSTNESQFVDLRGFFTVPSTYVDGGGNTNTPMTVLVALRVTAAPGTSIYVAKPFFMKNVPSTQTTFSPYRVGRAGWRINKAGSATFNDAVIKSDIAIGSAPYIYGGKLRGTGAVMNKDGTFAFGSSANNMIFDGTALTLNVPFIQNPKSISVTASIAAASNAMSVGAITVASGAEITVPSDSTWTIT